MSDALPILAVQNACLEAVTRGPLVVSAPTGSGKSTQLPRWFRGLGRVLVIEPRRLACRALARRVAELEGAHLGEAVGYMVRDDRKMRTDTEIVFATPGIVLRMLAGGEALGYDTVILDEFHERSLDVDLTLALLTRRPPKHLIVMSATLEADRLAEHLEGTWVQAEGRTHPVDISYLDRGTLLPTLEGLESRVIAAVTRHDAEPGDMLVFLPGKGEISSIARALRGETDRDVLPLHGGLSLAEQSKIFGSSRRGRVVLSTNVAETSLTVPGVRTVIDSGLVRRTRYHDGRSLLALTSIASDSATQRAGRAGRTAPGRCVRLWSRQAQLQPMTPPEMARESLVPLVLAAAACDASVEELPFFDTPRDYAVKAAHELLLGLGALDERGGVTARGRRLFQLPIDAALGRLLLEGDARGRLDDVIDLVAGLATRAPLFRGPLRSDIEERPTDDASAIIGALRGDDRIAAHVNLHAKREAERLRSRLRGLWNLDARAAGGKINLETLAGIILTAWPRSAFLKRTRRGKISWNNGGTEVILSRGSAVDPESAEALLVIAAHGVGDGAGAGRIMADRALPVRNRWLAKQGLGEDVLRAPGLDRGRVVSKIDRVYAGSVLASREEIPTGRLARESIGALFLAGRLKGFDGERVRADWARWELFARLTRRGTFERLAEAPTGDTLEAWVAERLETLGVERADDLALLSPSDLALPALPESIAERFDRDYPLTFAIGNTRYTLSYDLKRQEVTFVQVAGTRKDPPPLNFLPPLKGWKLLFRHKSRVHVLRA